MKQQHQNGSDSKHTINYLKKALAQQYTRTVLIHTRRIQAFISRYNKNIAIHSTLDCVFVYRNFTIHCFKVYIIFALRMKRHYSKIESYDLICFFPSSFFSSFAFRSLYAASHSMLSVTVRCISFCHLRVVFAIFLLPFRFNRTRDFRIPAKLSRSNVCKS